MKNPNSSKKKISAQQKNELLEILEARFRKNMHRHLGVQWAEVRSSLESAPDKVWSLNEMEKSGGEPDVVCQHKRPRNYIFYDCSAESPIGRRSVCYDSEGQKSRKDPKPENNAVDLAAAMGIEILTEDEYRELQQLGSFDTKTSSWLRTPGEIRTLGGAIFGDSRYGRVFIYHNGAQSYYVVRGFRGALIV